jgi:molybdopterin-containing oxidoreductase family iron-sulfur binding subunit
VEKEGQAMSDTTDHTPSESPGSATQSDQSPPTSALPAHDEPTISVSRRRLIQGTAATLALVAAGALPRFLAAASESSTEGGTGLEHLTEHDGAVNYPGEPVYYAEPAGDESWAMVIDVNACVGCRKCAYSCMEENNIGRTSGFTYIQLLEMPLGSNELEHGTLDYIEGGKPDKWYLPIQCMHCAKPTCVYGCPVTATWREPDGIVVIDYDKCIACRNCMVTCPYDARHFNWVEPHVPPDEINPDVPLHDKHSVVEKCTFCIHKTRDGATTSCVEACPVGARMFGDLNDPDSNVSRVLRDRRSYRLKEEVGNEPAIWYVG